MRGGRGTLPVAAWERRYLAAVVASDILVALVVAGAAPAAGFGTADAAVYAPMGIVILLGSLLVCRAWQPKVLGQGAEEFRRLGRAAFTTLAVLGCTGLAIGGPLVRAQTVRPWVFGIFPCAVLLAFPMRYLLRRCLHHYRGMGRCLLPVIAAGSPGTVADLVARTRAQPHLGWRIDATCTFGGRQDGGRQDSASPGSIAGVPVVGTPADIVERIQQGGYRIVAVTPDSYWTPERLQRLAWKLEGTAAEMVVAPVLMEVAGPRLQVSAVLGMPLLRVSPPAFTGARRIVKGIVDRLGAGALTLLLSPLLLSIAAAIKLGDRGPVIYQQRRVGKDGRRFTMLKFRTMIVDADARRDLLATGNEGAGPLFKLRRDPRVTRVGEVLRRYSLDELPQLVNVLTGGMSLVGPRPPLPEETEQYGDDVRRRLLVKPGVTGLWQVSGRSDLSWEESVRLDLRYVEDWSLALDALILWKTLHAVLHGRGAY